MLGGIGAWRRERSETSCTGAGCLQLDAGASQKHRSLYQPLPVEAQRTVLTGALAATFVGALDDAATDLAGALAADFTGAVARAGTTRVVEVRTVALRCADLWGHGTNLGPVARDRSARTGQKDHASSGAPQPEGPASARCPRGRGTGLRTAGG